MEASGTILTNIVTSMMNDTETGVVSPFNNASTRAPAKSEHHGQAKAYLSRDKRYSPNKQHLLNREVTILPETTTASGRTRAELEKTMADIFYNSSSNDADTIGRRHKEYNQPIAGEYCQNTSTSTTPTADQEASGQINNRKIKRQFKSQTTENLNQLFNKINCGFIDFYTAVRNEANTIADSPRPENQFDKYMDRQSKLKNAYQATLDSYFSDYKNDLADRAEKAISMIKKNPSTDSYGLIEEINETVIMQQQKIDKHREQIFTNTDQFLSQTNEKPLEVTLNKFQSMLNRIKDRFNEKIRNQTIEKEKHINGKITGFFAKSTKHPEIKEKEDQLKTKLTRQIKESKNSLTTQTDNRKKRLGELVNNISDQHLRDEMSTQTDTTMTEITQATNKHIVALDNLLTRINSGLLPFTTHLPFDKEQPPSQLVLNFAQEIYRFHDNLFWEHERISTHVYQAVCSAENKEQADKQVILSIREMNNAVKTCKKYADTLANIVESRLANNPIQSGRTSASKHVKELHTNVCFTKTMASTFRESIVYGTSLIWEETIDPAILSPIQITTTQSAMINQTMPYTTDTGSPLARSQVKAHGLCKPVYRGKGKLITPNKHPLTTETTIATTEDQIQKTRISLLNEITRITKETKSIIDNEIKQVEDTAKEVLNLLHNFQDNDIAKSAHSIAGYALFYGSKLSDKFDNGPEIFLPDFTEEKERLTTQLNQALALSKDKIDSQAALAQAELRDYLQAVDENAALDLSTKNTIRDVINSNSDQITGQQNTRIRRMDHYRAEVEQITESTITRSESALSEYWSDIQAGKESKSLKITYRRQLWESLKSELPATINVNDIFKKISASFPEPEPPARLGRAAAPDNTEPTPVSSSAGKHRGMLFEALSVTGALLSRIIAPRMSVVDTYTAITDQSVPIMAGAESGGPASHPGAIAQPLNYITSVNRDLVLAQYVIANLSGHPVARTPAKRVPPPSVNRFPDSVKSAIHNNPASHLFADTFIIMPVLLMQVYQHLIAPGRKQSVAPCWTLKNIVDIATLQECHWLGKSGFAEPANFYHAVLCSPLLGRENADRTFALDQDSQPVIHGTSADDSTRYFRNGHQGTAPISERHQEFIAIVLDIAAADCLQSTDVKAPGTEIMDDELTTGISEVLPHVSPRDQAIIARAMMLKRQQATTWLTGVSNLVWPVHRDDQIREIHQSLQPARHSQSDPGSSGPVVDFLDRGHYPQAKQHFLQFTDAELLESIQEMVNRPDFCCLDQSGEAWQSIQNGLAKLDQRSPQETGECKITIITENTNAELEENAQAIHNQFLSHKLRQLAWALMAYQYDIKIDVMRALLRPMTLQQRITREYPDITAYEAQVLSEIIPEMLDVKTNTYYEKAKCESHHDIELPPVPYQSLQYHGQQVDKKLAQFIKLKTRIRSLYSEVVQNTDSKEDIISSVALNTLRTQHESNLSVKQQNLFIRQQLQEESRTT